MQGHSTPTRRVTTALLAAALACGLALVPAAASAKPKKPVTQAQLRKALQQAELAEQQAELAQQQAQQALALAQQALAGNGGTVSTGQIADGAVTNPKLGPLAVTADKLADDAVAAGKVAPGAINAQDLFGPNVIGAGALAAGAINAQNLFGNGVIAAGALAPGVINHTDLFTNGVIGPNTLAGASINASPMFANGVIEAPALDEDAVTHSAVADGAIDTPEIVDDAVGPAQTAVIPAARVTFDATQNTAVPDSDPTDTPVTWNQEVFDTADLHTGTSPNLVAPIAGVYSVSTTIELNNAANADAFVDTFFDVDLLNNGNTIAYTQSFSAATPSAGEFWDPVDLNVSTLVSLAAGDAVSAAVSQYSGFGTALALNGGDQQSSLAMAWAGPAS